MAHQTMVQKIFERHVQDEPFPGLYALKVDYVLCHEITTPPAINDLRDRGLDKVFNPERIKATVDHVAPPKDADTALQYRILKEWCKQHGITFYDLGRHGICHALFPEKGYVRPGEVIICGDSHTCTMGAFGTFAVGVGTTYLETGILTGVTFFRVPETVKFELTGRLPKGVYPKDIILHLISQYGVSYMTNRVAEFAGEGAKTIDMEGRMTICNMMAEFGGTTGLFYPDEQTLQYLKYRDLGMDKYNPDAVAYRKELEARSDREILEEWRQLWPDPDAPYKAVHALDLSTLEPVVTALADHPKDDKPSLGKSVTQQLGGKINLVFIGSCTNGRISDMRVVAEILKGRRVHPDVPLVIVPATTEVSRLCMTEGLTEIFMEAGALVDTPSCSMCLGMKSVVPQGHVCASSSNRNFPGRMGRGARAQLMSPATAAASAVRGAIADPREFLN